MSSQRAKPARAVHMWDHPARGVQLNWVAQCGRVLPNSVGHAGCGGGAQLEETTCISCLRRFRDTKLHAAAWNAKDAMEATELLETRLRARGRKRSRLTLEKPGPPG